MKAKTSSIGSIIQWGSIWIGRLFGLPSFSHRKRSVAQERVHEQFADAVRFAKSNIKDPVSRRFFEHRAKPGHSAFITAVSMYLRHSGTSMHTTDR